MCGWGFHLKPVFFDILWRKKLTIAVNSYLDRYFYVSIVGFFILFYFFHLPYSGLKSQKRYTLGVFFVFKVGGG